MIPCSISTPCGYPESRRAFPRHEAEEFGRAWSRGVPVVDASGKKRKPALAWTFLCHGSFFVVSSRVNSTHHRSARESADGILLASALAAMSSRVKDGWRPSSSLGPRLKPPRFADRGRSGLQGAAEPMGRVGVPFSGPVSSKWTIRPLSLRISI